MQICIEIIQPTVVWSEKKWNHLNKLRVLFPVVATRRNFLTDKYLAKAKTSQNFFQNIWAFNTVNEENVFI